MTGLVIRRCVTCLARVVTGPRCKSCACALASRKPRKPSARSHCQNVTPEHRNAIRRETRRLIARGEIRRPKRCTRCRRRDGVGFQSNLHAHHYDYDDPRHVQWVCESCHYDIHYEFSVARIQAKRQGFVPADPVETPPAQGQDRTWSVR